MVKSITKIRPYRVFKQSGLYYVKINKKKIFIKHHKKINKNGDKQIVKVIINNLLAQRKSRARKRKTKDVIGIAAAALQPANGKVNVSRIGDSKAAEQAPTVDPLYANANKRTSQPENKIVAFLYQISVVV